MWACRNSGGSDTPQGIRYNILEAMLVEVSIKDEKYCDQISTRKRLEGLGEELIVNEASGFGLPFNLMCKTICFLKIPQTFWKKGESSLPHDPYIHLMKFLQKQITSRNLSAISESTRILT